MNQYYNDPMKTKQFNIYIPSLLVTLFLMLLSITTAVYSQMVDYHREESQAISWNCFPVFDAALMGNAGISLSASPAFSAMMNPALLTRISQQDYQLQYKKRRFHLGISGYYMKHEAFQYWGVNQGAVMNPSTLPDQKVSPGGIAISFSQDNVSFSTGWYRTTGCTLPPFHFSRLYWAYQGHFNGVEDRYFAAFAARLGKVFSLGMKMEYLDGSRQVEIDEFYKYYDVNGPAGELLLKRQEQHDVHCIIPTIGAALALSPNWTLAATISTPLKGKAQRNLTLCFDNYTTPPLSESMSSEDSFYRPAQISLGTSYTITLNANQEKSHSQQWSSILLSAEMFYCFWKGYQYVYFNQPLPREMRNTLVASLGMTYGFHLPSLDIFLRLGYRLDPQPVITPKTSLHVLSIGTGLHRGTLSLNLAYAYILAPSSFIEQRHSLFNMSLDFNF